MTQPINAMRRQERCIKIQRQALERQQRRHAPLTRHHLNLLNHLLQRLIVLHRRVALFRQISIDRLLNASAERLDDF